MNDSRVRFAAGDRWVVVAVESATDTGTADPVWNEAWPAIRGLDDLARMVDGLPRGVALLTPDLRVLHVNPAGRAIEGAGREALAGPAAPLLTAGITVPDRGTHALAGGGRREVEYSDIPLEVQGQHLVVRTFLDVTEERCAMRWQQDSCRLFAPRYRRRSTSSYTCPSGAVKWT